MSKPRFSVCESWAGDGDVDVWFHDGISANLEDRVVAELNENISHFQPTERSVYHVERVVDGIINRMHSNGNLIVNRKNKWAWAESVNAVCKK